MELSISDFPEEAFRIMIKAKYDRSEEGTGQLYYILNRYCLRILVGIHVPGSF